MAAAQAASTEIAAHERECALRYEQINKTLTSMFGVLKWVGTLAASAIVGLGVWGVQQWLSSAGEKARTDQAQFETLRSQLAALSRQRVAPAVVVTPPASPVPSAPPTLGVSDPANPAQP